MRNKYRESKCRESQADFQYATGSLIIAKHLLAMPDEMALSGHACLKAPFHRAFRPVLALRSRFNSVFVKGC
jgi:hypothetical protein